MEDRITRLERRLQRTQTLLLGVTVAAVLGLAANGAHSDEGATEFKAPFTVVGKGGRTLFEVVESDNGAIASFYDEDQHPLVTMRPVVTAGSVVGGSIGLGNPAGKLLFYAGANADGANMALYDKQGLSREFVADSNEHGGGMSVYSKNGKLMSSLISADVLTGMNVESPAGSVFVYSTDDGHPENGGSVSINKGEGATARACAVLGLDKSSHGYIELYGDDPVRPVFQRP